MFVNRRFKFRTNVRAFGPGDRERDPGVALNRPPRRPTAPSMTRAAPDCPRCRACAGGFRSLAEVMRGGIQSEAARTELALERPPPGDGSGHRPASDANETAVGVELSEQVGQGRTLSRASFPGPPKPARDPPGVLLPEDSEPARAPAGPGSGGYPEDGGFLPGASGPGPSLALRASHRAEPPAAKIAHARPRASSIRAGGPEPRAGRSADPLCRGTRARVFPPSRRGRPPTRRALAILAGPTRTGGGPWEKSE